MVDKQCFECGAPVLDAWVSTSYAIVLCINCAGRHRALGTHNSFVKSWTRDVWSEELKRVVKCGGNDAALEYFNNAGISDLPIEKRYATREAHEYSVELFAKAEVDVPAGFFAPERCKTAEEIRNEPEAEVPRVADGREASGSRGCKDCCCGLGRLATSILSKIMP